MSNEKNNLTSEEGLLASLSAAPASKTRHVSYDISPAAIFKVLFTLAAVWLLIHVFEVLILVVLSLMLVATFNPMVRKLQARLSRPWAVMGVITGTVLLLLGLLMLVIPPLFNQGAHLFQNSSSYAKQVELMLASHHIHIKVEQQMEHFLSDMSGANPPVLSILTSVASWITAVVTVVILTIYLLIEGPQVGLSLMRLFPRKDRLSVRKLGSEISDQVGGYMRGQLITSALAGAFSFITLWLLGVPEALALGALAALADAVPIVGLLIALLPAALITLTLSPAKAGIVVVVYLCYHQLESNIIAPKVYGNTLGLSLSVTLISILIGVELMGMLGAILALPFAAAVPSVLAYIQEWQEGHNVSDTETHLP